MKEITRIKLSDMYFGRYDASIEEINKIVEEKISLKQRTHWDKI